MKRADRGWRTGGAVEQDGHMEDSAIQKINGIQKSVTDAMFELYEEQNGGHHDYNQQKRLMNEIRQGDGGYFARLRSCGTAPTASWRGMGCAPPRTGESPGSRCSRRRQSREG